MKNKWKTKITKETKYNYKTPDLCRILGVSRFVLVRWERKGIFTPPRSIGNHRIFTQKQVTDILKAFSPGGRGQWHFKLES